MVVRDSLTTTLLSVTELVRQHPQPHNTLKGISTWRRSLPPGRWDEWVRLRSTLEELLPEMEQAKLHLSKTDADWLYWAALLLPVGVIARAVGMDAVEFSRTVKSRHLVRGCAQCGAKRWVRNRAEYKEEWKFPDCRECRQPAAPAPSRKVVKRRKLLPLELDALHWLLSRQHDANFLESLKRQVKEWCYAPVKYRDAPLSPRQFQCLFENFHTWQKSEEYVEAQRKKTRPSLN